MNIRVKDFKEFFKSFGKFSKIFLYIGTLITVTLLFGGISLRIMPLSGETVLTAYRLSEEMVRCALDCFSAVYIPTMVTELLKNYR